MPGRLRQLDALRAIAVFLVMVHHIPKLEGVTPTWLLMLKQPGWSGVDLFFVLSGFLVSGLLFREYQRNGRIRIGRFFVRRGLKIYPAFYLFLLATLVVQLRVGGNHLSDPAFRTSLLYEALFVQNYGYRHAIWNHTWSLAVEEHFYLLLGLLVYLRTLSKRSSPHPFRGVLLLFPIVALGSLAWRCGVVLQTIATGQGFGDAQKMYTMFWTHARIDALLAGVVLSYLYHFHPDRTRAWLQRRRVPVALASVALVASIVPFRVDSIYVQTVGLTCTWLGYAGILMLALYQEEREHPSRLSPIVSALAAIGTYSYSIYLWHSAVLRWTDGTLTRLFGIEGSYWPRIGVFAVGSIVLGVAMSRLLELPVLKLRDRLFPSPIGAEGSTTTDETRVDAVRTQEGL